MARKDRQHRLDRGVGALQVGHDAQARVPRARASPHPTSTDGQRSPKAPAGASSRIGTGPRTAAKVVQFAGQPSRKELVGVEQGRQRRQRGCDRSGAQDLVAVRQRTGQFGRLDALGRHRLPVERKRRASVCPVRRHEEAVCRSVATRIGRWPLAAIRAGGGLVGEQEVGLRRRRTTGARPARGSHRAPGVEHSRRATGSRHDWPARAGRSRPKAARTGACHSRKALTVLPTGAEHIGGPATGPCSPRSTWWPRPAAGPAPGGPAGSGGRGPPPNSQVRQEAGHVSARRQHSRARRSSPGS